MNSFVPNIHRYMNPDKTYYRNQYNSPYKSPHIHMCSRCHNCIDILHDKIPNSLHTHQNMT